MVPAECKSQGDTKGPSHTSSSPSQCEGQALRATETAQALLASQCCGLSARPLVNLPREMRIREPWGLGTVSFQDPRPFSCPAHCGREKDEIHWRGEEGSVPTGGSERRVGTRGARWRGVDPGALRVGEEAETAVGECGGSTGRGE